MGFFVPSDDYTQKVRVVNTVNVDGSVEVDNTVDVNLEAINGYYNAFYNSYDEHEDEYYRIPVYNYE